MINSDNSFDALLQDEAVGEAVFKDLSVPALEKV